MLLSTVAEVIQNYHLWMKNKQRRRRWQQQEQKNTHLQQGMKWHFSMYVKPMQLYKVLSSVCQYFFLLSSAFVLVFVTINMNMITCCVVGQKSQIQLFMWIFLLICLDWAKSLLSHLDYPTSVLPMNPIKKYTIEANVHVPKSINFTSIVKNWLKVFATTS